MITVHADPDAAVKLVNPAWIVLIEPLEYPDKKGSRIVLADGQTLSVRKTMKQLEKLIPAPRGHVAGQPLYVSRIW